MKNEKSIEILICMILVLTALAGCSKSEAPAGNGGEPQGGYRI